MALTHELVRIGNWFFRWRSYLPLLLIVLFLLALVDQGKLANPTIPSRAWELCCLALSFLGLAVRVLTVGFVPRGTSGRNTKAQVAEVLNTAGIYSLVRHPLYLGNFLMWLGFALFPGIWWLALIVILVFWLYYEKIIYAEEAFLRERFGESFLVWAEQTPLFFPRFSRWQPSPVQFSWRSALKREYASFFAMISTFFGQHVLSRLWLQRTLALDPFWVIIVTVSLISCLTIRFLKKKTQLLADDR
ncbi:MAG: methyltransferase family protein [Desulfobacca sp.]|uniref:methyltransferase family protein n=1 Tax=Desulfobacca sp. TaxID=2067990 RepID=UPI0040498499